MKEIQKLSNMELKEIEKKLPDFSLNEIFILQQKIKDVKEKIKHLENSIQEELNFRGKKFSIEKGMKGIIEDEVVLKEKTEYEIVYSPEIKEVAKELGIDLVALGIIKVTEEFKISNLQKLQKANPKAMELNNYISWVPKKDKNGNIKKNWILVTKEELQKTGGLK